MMGMTDTGMDLKTGLGSLTDTMIVDSLVLSRARMRADDYD